MIHFKVKHLACIKGKQYLFRNLSFSLKAGELLLVQGANGSGKTTLLKILAGIATSEKGNIENGNEVAYLGHLSGIKKGLTVVENILLQLSLAKQAIVQEEIDFILKQFGMDHLNFRLCARLSMGQQRKVGLIAMILKQKPIWVLDEPFTALDKVSTEIFCHSLQTHLSKGGIAIVASHLVDGIQAHQQIELLPC
jgi:heme exporter protein A